VQGIVYDRALLLIVRECANLHKAEEEASLEWPCQCTIQASMGVLCYHDLFKRLRDGGQVLPEDIHAFWWYDRTKVSSLENTNDGAPEPVTVKGKGRLKGLRGNKKGEGSTGISFLFKISIITVLRSCFLINLGTRRDPSLFEYMSTAPTLLEAVQPAICTALRDSIASVSTT
jgi:hypothetical protein